MSQLGLRYLEMRHWLAQRRGELDEKAVLIVFFVIAALVGLSPLGQAIAQTFQNLRSQLFAGA